MKMVAIVNSSIKMSKGKTAAQVSHAISEIVFSYYRQPLTQWFNDGSMKIILTAPQEQMIECHAKAKELGRSIIYDAGRTEVEKGTLTCVALFGETEKIDAITASLELL